MRIFAASGLFVFALGIFLVACQTPSAHSPSSKLSRDGRLTSTISINGSSTMLSLIKVWAKEFQKDNPEARFSIASNDSGGGIALLIRGSIDIALSSRDLTSEERLLARSKNVKWKSVTVARDAIAFIVNPVNQVSSIKLDELKKIYDGQINDWHELGGKALSIDRLTREKDSGTFAYFQEHVMQGDECSSSAKLLPSVDQTIGKVMDDPGAIAFVGLHQAEQACSKVKILGLKLIDQSKAVKPSAASSVADYPLSRPLFIFADEPPKESTQKFIDFCLSDKGQQLVPASGYIPVK